MSVSVSPAHWVSPDRRAPMTMGGRENTDANAWLMAATLPAAAVLEFHCGPMALWNEDRTQCVFNRPMRALLGFCENDFSAGKDLWLARVDASDRERLSSLWRNLQIGAEPMVYRYRFMPLGGTLAIDLEETALRFAVRPEGTSAFLSRYNTTGEARVDVHDPSPVHGLVHKIGNSLQAVRGEVDLLRLSGGLPQRSFDSITQGVESIHCLVAQIDDLAGKDSTMIYGENGRAPAAEHAAKSGDGEV